MTKILFLGATGYVGGPFLVALQSKYPDFTYIALVRSERSVNTLSDLGIECVIATSAEHSKIAALAAQVDIVINAADSDDVALNDALLEGLKTKYAEGRGVGALVHMSGIMIFSDHSKEGKFDPNGKVWDDSNVEDIKALTPAMVHGPVDVSILKAGETKTINTYIVCPAVIYSIGDGPGSKSSMYYRHVINSVLTQKYGYIIGEGTNVVGTVHIKDVTALNMLVFEAALSALGNSLSSSAYERYYIASVYEHNRREFMRILTDVLYKQGLLESNDVKHVSFEEAPQFNLVLAGNVPARGRRAYDLGWTPTCPDQSSVVEEDIHEALKLFPNGATFRSPAIYEKSV